MNTTLLNLPHILQTAVTIEDVFALVAKAVDSLGFDKTLLCVRHYESLTRSHDKIQANFNTDWMQSDHGKTHEATVQTVMQTLRTGRLAVWSEAVFAVTPKVWQTMQDNGFGCALGLARLSLPNCVHALILARGGEPLSANAALELEPQLQHILMCASVALNRLSQASAVAVTNPNESISKHTRMQLSAHQTRSSNATLNVLNPREINILRWSADGKSAEDVADILGLSTRMVNHNLGEILIKMNVPNKTAAVAKAMLAGLLY